MAAPAASTPDPAPPIAIVVATHDRAHLLARLVAAVETQAGVGGLELVVVDDGSTDATAEVLEELRAGASVPMRVLHLPANRGPASARNAGWRSSAAAVIAFTDDDCVPGPDWCRELLAAIDGADLVQGRTLPDPQQDHLRGPFSRTLEVVAETGFYQTCNIAYRRDVLDRLGGFDERFRYPAGEDTDLAWRAIESGARTRFCETATVHHDIGQSSLLHALADTWRWQSVALVAGRHPGIRRNFAAAYLWRRSHLPAVLAAAGIAGLVGAGDTRSRTASTLLCLPYVRLRLLSAPLPAAGPRRRAALLPAALLLDLAEVGVCLIGSARHRSLVV